VAAIAASVFVLLAVAGVAAHRDANSAICGDEADGFRSTRVSGGWDDGPEQRREIEAGQRFGEQAARSRNSELRSLGEQTSRTAGRALESHDATADRVRRGVASGIEMLTYETDLVAYLEASQALNLHCMAHQRR
jgi:hypothetical protein